MSKVTELLSLLESFSKNSLNGYSKRLKKDGMRTTTAGRKTTINSPKTGRKIEITDTGRELKIKRYEKGKMTSTTKARGLPDDIENELSWASNKEK